MLEMRPGPAKACTDTAGRSDVATSLQTAALDLFAQIGGCGVPQKPSCNEFYVCQIDEAGKECHRDLLPTTEVGWCYIDPEANPDDNSSFVARCPMNMRRLIRFVDPAKNTPAPDGYAIISCDGPA